MGTAAAPRYLRLSLPNCSAASPLLVAAPNPLLRRSVAEGFAVKAVADEGGKNAPFIAPAWSAKSTAALLTAWSAASCSAATVPAPAAVKEAPKPAPPYAPKPAIRPFSKLPVAKPVIPPTVMAVAKGVAARKAKEVPAVSGANAIPARIGKMLSKNPASGRPVSGLIVREPPFFIASSCKDWTSWGDMCTSMESGPRPWVAMWLARTCRLIFASQNGGWSILSCCQR